MQGKDFLKFLPMNKSALERQKDLEDTVRSWVQGDKDWKITSVSDWFDKVYSNPTGKWIWCPPPVLAKVAVEQLCEVKHVFPDTQHIFISPALFTGYWRKSLGKISDSMFSLKAGCVIWDACMYEPLTVSFVKPLLSSAPWKAKHLPEVDKWERLMLAVQW